MSNTTIDQAKAIEWAKLTIARYNELLADMDYSAELISRDHDLAQAFLDAQKDAERYRWMAADPRSRASWEFCDTKAEMDERIDAAIIEGDANGR